MIISQPKRPFFVLVEPGDPTFTQRKAWPLRSGSFFAPALFAAMASATGAQIDPQRPDSNGQNPGLAPATGIHLTNNGKKGCHEIGNT
jgi:hypothetical protein